MNDGIIAKPTRTFPVVACEVAVELVAEIEDLDTRRACEKSLGMAPDIVQCVKAFHLLYDMPTLRPSQVREDFSHIAPERLAMRFALIEEEYRELCEAMDFKVEFNYQYMDEDENWVYAKNLKDAVVNTEGRDLPEVGDACVDLAYVIVGFCLENGIDFHALLREVQASNLTKMGSDGKPVRREDGKILKGPEYIKANPEMALRGVGLRYSGITLSTKPEAEEPIS